MYRPRSQRFAMLIQRLNTKPEILSNSGLSYGVDLECIANDNLREKYVEIDYDEDTKKFVTQCNNETCSLRFLYFNGFVELFLSPFVSRTSINGLLSRGSMHVCSSEQFKTVLSISDEFKFEHALDIGAGDGNVTLRLQNFCKKITTTEVSPVMAWRLYSYGFNSIQTDTLDHPGLNEQYDLISLLNVLDRCDEPFTLLKDITQKMNHSTKLLIAIVIPFRPSVERGTKWTESLEIANMKQYNNLQMLPNNATFEDHIEWFVDNFFSPLGLKVERFTRTPYISSGDLTVPFYVLDNVVFVLRI